MESPSSTFHITACTVVIMELASESGDDAGAMLAGMKDDEAHVRVSHFYDGVAPLTKIETEALARAPVTNQMLRGSFWLGHVDGPGKHLLDLINTTTLP